MLTEALRLATAGWRVLPCHHTGPNAKAPIGRRGFVPHGLTDATLDPRVITRWWTAEPHALIGAVVPDDRLVIDIDPYHGGSREALETLIAGPLPVTASVLSGRGDGGTHLYYRAPQGGRNLTSIRLPDGVDLRKGGRNYCIAPPSLHPATGLPYRWVPAPFTPAPQALLALLTPAPRPVWTGPPVSDRRVLAWLELIASSAGNRNDVLYWVCCRAAEAGVLDRYTPDIELAAAGVGLDDREVAKVFRSATHPRVVN
jgi:hypothetical protein